MSTTNKIKIKIIQTLAFVQLSATGPEGATAATVVTQADVDQQPKLRALILSRVIFRGRCWPQQKAETQVGELAIITCCWWNWVSSLLHYTISLKLFRNNFVSWKIHFPAFLDECRHLWPKTTAHLIQDVHRFPLFLQSWVPNFVGSKTQPIHYGLKCEFNGTHTHRVIDKTSATWNWYAGSCGRRALCNTKNGQKIDGRYGTPPKTNIDSQKNDAIIWSRECKKKNIILGIYLRFWRGVIHF